MLYRASLLAACLILSACTQWRFNLGSPLKKLELPPESVTYLSEVLVMLGPPQRISASDGGYVLAWEHWHVKENALGFSLGLLGADFMSIDVGDMYAKGEFLLATFDREHRLSSVSRSTWDNRGGGGRAVQPFFSFVDVVETGDLVGRLPQHRWGASMLQRLPEALNDGSDPDAGENGLEQRGTPPNVGQRSLEMH
ncbi:MAG: hypothetical protein CME59_11030 [Halioglobus sp.]|nr:hypothetical protein [Halioglobus sp.]|tara:strand:- start:1072 stop:1659 length:588 start_codon:yes stop_codon:yes gene_type:complete